MTPQPYVKGSYPTPAPTATRPAGAGQEPGSAVAAQGKAEARPSPDTHTTSSQQRQEHTLRPVRPTHAGTNDTPLPTDAVLRAIRLVGAVHEHGPDEVAHIIARLNRSDLRALTVTLAAMVPDDYTPVELLAWNDSRYGPVEAPTTQTPLFPAAIPATRRLRPHGTHAAFVRHRSLREEPCSLCWYGEREYQRDRSRSRREQAAS